MTKCLPDYINKTQVNYNKTIIRNTPKQLSCLNLGSGFNYLSPTGNSPSHYYKHIMSSRTFSIEGFGFLLGWVKNTKPYKVRKSYLVHKRYTN